MNDLECLNSYNDFSPLDDITMKIVDFLVGNAPNLWKLLYYTNPNVYPLDQPELTKKQISEMIVSMPQEMYDPDVSAKKNILFQIDIDEALSVAVPQIRMEVGSVMAINSYRGFVNIDFQIIVPNKQRLFLSQYSVVADRRVAIFRELAKAFNGKFVPQSSLYSKMFINKSAPYGAGSKTGAYAKTFNKNFSGYLVTFSALL